MIKCGVESVIFLKYSPGIEKASNRRAPHHTPSRFGRVLCGYLATAALVLAVGSCAGEFSAAEIWRSLSGEEGDAPRAAWRQWQFFRLLPLLYAAVVGGALALCGVVFQACLRNPLAEPYILGISGAASLGAVCVRLFTWGTWGVAGAFGGALSALVLLLGLARWARLYDPATLILCGAILNAIFGALIQLAFSFAPPDRMATSLMWVMGSINPETVGGALWGNALLITSLVVVAVTAGFVLAARSLDLLTLGEEDAADLGLRPQRMRAVALAVASCLTGLIVAVAGPIGFVGLVVPHVVRQMHGPLHRQLLPLSVLAGGIFLMLAYVISRIIPDLVLPIGAVTALVGGPFFLILLARRRGSPRP